MYDYYTAISLSRATGEPGREARFREELDRKPKKEHTARVRRGRAAEIEALVEHNLHRVGHFIRFA